MEAPPGPPLEAPSPKRPRLGSSENRGPNRGAGEVAEAAACLAGGPKTPPPAGLEARAAPALTPEQRERIERNRRLALERLREGGQQGDGNEGKVVDSGQGAAAPAGGLTAEQLGRIERSRLAALERRQAEAAAAAAPGLTSEQRERIERQRLAALERRRQQQAAEAEPRPEGARRDGAAPTPPMEKPAGDTPPTAAPGSPAPSTPELPPVPMSPSLNSVSLSSASSSCSSSGDDESDTSSEASVDSDEEQPASAEPVAEEGPAASAACPGGGAGGAEPESSSSDSDSDSASELAAEECQGPAGSAEKDWVASSCAPRLPVEDSGASQCCAPHLLEYKPSRAAVPAAKAPKERTSKQALVAQLLCRWWYVLPDWPPKDFDYDAALRASGFRRVAVERFHLEPEQDERGCEKVFAIPGYPGLFRSGYGQLVDVRPVEGRPSYDQLMLRPESEIHGLLVSAYERQLEVLEAQPCQGPEAADLRQDVRRQLAKVKNSIFARMFKPRSKEGDVGNDP